MRVRANNASGGGGVVETKIISTSANSMTRTFSGLTVGKTYRLVAEGAWTSTGVTFSLSSATNCTNSVITPNASIKNHSYSAAIGYTEYEIVPSATSVALTFNRSDVQHFIWVGEGASSITIS